jgi:hypothetical protein
MTVKRCKLRHDFVENRLLIEEEQGVYADRVTT